MAKWRLLITAGKKHALPARDVSHTSCRRYGGADCGRKLDKIAWPVTADAPRSQLQFQLLDQFAGRYSERGIQLADTDITILESRALNP